ncbi:hypothetical protein ACWGH8_03825 [Nonomuraea muscovyensis]|uniref:hypothetical protein n=1 Tax=Nonomuraea muscovyensis TaxID=1124761 RepID=UPI0033E61B47|nr:hypothetical protein [Nonomuraea muscovyensis]
MNMRPLLATAVLAVALTACGAPAERDDGVAGAGGAKPSATTSASASAPADRREAQLKFAQCMREHGVDMDDPAPDGAIRIKAGRDDKGKVDEAQRACKHFMEAAVGELHGKPDKEALDQVLKFAQCMRQHGIPMKDPSSDGRIEINIPRGTPEEKVKAAHEACKDFEPGGGRP